MEAANKTAFKKIDQKKIRKKPKAKPSFLKDWKIVAAAVAAAVAMTAVPSTSAVPSTEAAPSKAAAAAVLTVAAVAAVVEVL